MLKTQICVTRPQCVKKKYATQDNNKYDHILKRGPGSIVGIANGYELDGPGIESWWGQDFLRPSRLVLGPTTQPPV